MPTPNVVPTGWRACTYGEVLGEDDERGKGRDDLPVLSVTKSRGPMLASDRFGKVLHSRDTSRYRVARRDTIVADPMLLWDGSIGIQRVVDAGLVSPDYRVYRTGSEVEPSFMAYVVRSPTMMRHYQGGARGTNVRRNRIARSDFLTIPLALPPLPEQRKIAAILSSVDDAIQRTDAYIDQLQVVKSAMLNELFGTENGPGSLGPRRRLGDLCQVVRGSTPRPAKDPRFFGGRDVPWITVGELSKDDTPTLTETRAFLTQAGAERSRLLEKGTVVLSNSGFGCGVPKLLGMSGCANDGIAAFLSLEQSVLPLYLYYVLHSMTPHLRASVARGVDQPPLHSNRLDVRAVGNALGSRVRLVHLENLAKRLAFSSYVYVQCASVAC